MAGEDPILLCSGGERDRVDRVMPWVEEVHTIPIMEERSLIAGFVREVLVPVLTDRGLDRGRLGIDAASTILHQEIAAAAARGGDRRRRHPMQQARAHQAARRDRAAGGGHRARRRRHRRGGRAVREGRRENDVAADAMRELFRLGGEYAHVMTPFVASGEHMAPPNRISTDKIIRHGDLVFIDIGACWAGYYGDVARVTVCGKPSHAPARDPHRAV